MGSGTAPILVLAMLHALPEMLGSKQCRRHGVGKILSDLRALIPENGCGPEIASRRDAVMVLEANCRSCRRCKIGRGMA